MDILLNSEDYENIDDQYICLEAAFVGGRSSDV